MSNDNPERSNAFEKSLEAFKKASSTKLNPGEGAKERLAYAMLVMRELAKATGFSIEELIDASHQMVGLEETWQIEADAARAAHENARAYLMAAAVVYAQPVVELAQLGLRCIEIAEAAASIKEQQSQ